MASGDLTVEAWIAPCAAARSPDELELSLRAAAASVGRVRPRLGARGVARACAALAALPPNLWTPPSEAAFRALLAEAVRAPPPSSAAARPADDPHAASSVSPRAVHASLGAAARASEIVSLVFDVLAPRGSVGVSNAAWAVRRVMVIVLSIVIMAVASAIDPADGSASSAGAQLLMALPGGALFVWTVVRTFAETLVTAAGTGSELSLAQQAAAVGWGELIAWAFNALWLASEGGALVGSGSSTAPPMQGAGVAELTCAALCIVLAVDGALRNLALARAFKVVRSGPRWDAIAIAAAASAVPEGPAAGRPARRPLRLAAYADDDAGADAELEFALGVAEKGHGAMGVSLITAVTAAAAAHPHMYARACEASAPGRAGGYDWSLLRRELTTGPVAAFFHMRLGWGIFGVMACGIGAVLRVYGFTATVREPHCNASRPAHVCMH